MNDEDYTRLAATGALRTYIQERRRRQAARRLTLIILSLLGLILLAGISIAFPLPTP